MTRPTRQQEQAFEVLAAALVSITGAARLDGKGRFGPAELRAVVAGLVKASSAFDADTLVARALELRGRSLGLRSGTAEMLTLLDGGHAPVDALLLADDEFRERVEALERELGDVG